MVLKPERRNAPAPPPPPIFAAASAPEGLVASRVFDALERVARGQPVRLTVVVSPAAPREEVEQALHRHPLWRVEERAPWVHDVELPNVHFPDLMEGRRILKRIDLGGRIFGVRVPSPEDRAIMRIALELPLASEQRRLLRGMGLLITREGAGDVSGEALGRSLAAFVATDWLGPVEVRRVALA
jgi:hypothetical protein